MVKKKDDDKYDILVKIVIIGDTAVGKTNILLRYVNQEYKMSHITTIGVDFKIKTVPIDGVKIKMQIWDTAGQERFKTITETYYKGAAGVVLVYSITDRKTFNNMENWLKQINENQPENIPKIIIGNKCDCSEAERQVTHAEGEALSKKFGLKFLQTSAKDNYNISEIFKQLGADIKQKVGEADIHGNRNITIQKGSSEKQGKNCEC